MKNNLVMEARRSISDFCMNECNAYCCRKGYLPVSKKKIDLVTQNQKKELEKQGIVKKNKDKYSYFLNPKGCVSLKDNRCTIYKDRPRVCRQFPIHDKGDVILISSRCLAVKENKLYSFIAKLKKKGYRVIISDNLYDSDFFETDVSSKED